MHDRKLDSALYSLLAVFLTFLFLSMPDTVTESVNSSLRVCAGRVIPSVFPFSVLSSFFIRSSGIDVIDRSLSRPFQKIFGIKSGAAAFFCGLIFGFPLGALCADSLYKNGKLTENECSRLLSFACCASPTFPVFAVGKGLFGCMEIGVFLWLLQLFSSVTVGVLFRFYKKDHTKTTSVKKETSPSPHNFAELISASVRDASAVILTVCGSVAFFSLLGKIVSNILFEVTENAYLRVFISSFFEFATGCSLAADAYVAGEISRAAALGFAGFAVGFSGLSVLCQNVSVVSENIPLSPLFIGKTLSGILTGIFAYLFSDLFFDSVSVSVTGEYGEVSLVFLIPSATIFLFSLIFGFQRRKNKCES